VRPGARNAVDRRSNDRHSAAGRRRRYELATSRRGAATTRQAARRRRRRRRLGRRRRRRRDHRTRTEWAKRSSASGAMRWTESRSARGASPPSNLPLTALSTLRSVSRRQHYSWTEMYAGRVAWCHLVRHGEYADGTDRQTDGHTEGRQTVTVRFPLWTRRA